MKTLRVYGDSFAAPTDGAKCWADLLSEQINLPLVNKGIAGSSTEYSIKCLVNDVTTNVIGDTDIVIFVTSTPGRLSFSYQNNKRPETASMYVRPPNKFNEKHYSVWYHQNRSHIEWSIVEQDFKLLSLNHQAYISLIKDIASSMPNTMFFVLANSDHWCHTPGTAPQNFFNPDIYLNTISNKELKNNLNYHDWIEHCGWDFRPNHLSVPNLKILANLLEEAINTRSINHISYGKFVSNILDPLKTNDQYLDYVSKGYLYDMFKIEWFLRNVPPLK